MRFTLKQVLDFCWEYRGKHGFKTFTYAQAAGAIVDAANNRNSLHVVSDDLGICGAIIITEKAESCHIFIHHIFTTRLGFRTLIQEAFKRYPGYSVVGLRKQKQVTYNYRNLKYGR